MKRRVRHFPELLMIFFKNLLLQYKSNSFSDFSKLMKSQKTSIGIQIFDKNQRLILQSPYFSIHRPKQPLRYHNSREF